MQRATRFGIVAAPLFVVAACNEPVSQAHGRPAGGEGPEFTVASGVTNTQIARGNLGPLHFHSRFDEYVTALEANENSDVEVRDQVYTPGGYSGWHSHEGPVFVVVKSGALTAYDASDPDCRPVVHPAGTAFIEATTVHNVRNEGTVDAEVGVFFFMPAGEPRRIDADAPANCPAIP
jgi:quercetin dioxygenase-like cupin family protein